MTSERVCSIPGAPKDIGAGAGPTIAEPVSWAIINRSKATLRFSPVSGKSAWIKNGVPYTCSVLSTAIERPGGERHALGTDRFLVMRRALSVLWLPVIRQPDDPEKYERERLATHLREREVHRGAYRLLGRWPAAEGGNSSRRWQRLRRDRPPSSRSAHSTQSAQAPNWGTLAVPVGATVWRPPREGELEADLSAALRFEQIAVETRL
jgi:hypothetical protein